MTDSGRRDRRNTRPWCVAGTLDGYRLSASDVRLRVRDLSVWGCVIDPDEGLYGGRRIRLQIDLPGEGWITVQAEALHKEQYGFAVKFLHVDEATRARIERTIERLAGPISS